jgi:dihydrofolate reductase
VCSIALIVACSENQVIGNNNQLPWHLSEDLKYFKRVTMGKPIIMGRLTYDSIGRPLPGRPNIVVTRQKDWQADGVLVAASLEGAIELAKEEAKTCGAEEVMIIGGAQIYRESVDLCNRIYLTEVHAKVEGDAYFPNLDSGQWAEFSRESFAPADKNPYSYSFVVLNREKP